MAYNDLNQALSGSEYTFTFDYLNEDEVKVSIDGAAPLPNTAYTLNGKTVTLTPVPSGSNIRIYRQTNLDDTEVKFASGSAIRASDLNKLADQLLHSAQETNHDSLSRFGANAAEADISMGGNKITNLSVDYGANADADADHEAASKGWVREYYHDVDAETIEIGENWVQSTDGYVATTGRTSVYVGEALKTALNDYINVSDGLTHSANDPADGEITIGIGQGSVDLDRIKPEDINTSSETVYGYASNAPTITGTDWTVTDDQVATLKAIAKRHDGIVQNNAPSGTDYLPGTVWLSESGSADTINDEGEQLNKYLAVWNGNEWVGVAGGGTWINQTRLIWVDAGNGDDTNDGHRVIVPMKTIQGAVNKAEDGDMIFVQPGVYTEYLPIDLGRKKNVSIIGLSMRSVFVHPHPTKKWNVTTDGAADSITNKVMEAGSHGNATSGTSEYETMFQLGSGSFVANMSLAGMKASGTRGDLHTDSEAAQQGWFFAFADNDGAGNAVKFQKSPYIQNCTAFADSAIDNTNYQPHSTTNQPAFGGDQTSAPTGGGLLVDGSVPHPDSPLRSFLTDAYTLICLDGPGALVKNEGYAQLVSTFGHFCHYHAKAESGGMINMSNCTTDFGRFGLIADGQSADSIFEGTVSATSTNNVIQIDATTAWTERNNNTPKPVNHMVVSLINNPSSASDFYPIKAVTEPSSGVYDIELYDNVSVTNDQTVYFYLRSTITTGGHVFEFAGAGTDYRAHPDNGGSPVEANQVKNEGAGKVYISSSDHNGNFKVGEVFSVSTDGASVTVNGTASVSGTSTLTGAVTTGGNVTVGGTLDAQSLTINGSAVNTSATYFDGSGDIKDTAMPDKVTAGTSAYPDSVTVDAQGRVTAISAGTEPVTSVTAASGSAVSVTNSKTPEVDIATFAGSSQKGIVVNDGTVGNDSKFLKGDGTWADPAQASYSLSSSQSGTTDIDLNLTGSSSSTVKLIKGTGIVLEQDPNSTGSTQEFKISAPSSSNAQIYISGTVPPSALAGDTWWDTNTGECYLYYTDADSSQWVQFAPQQRGTGNGTVTSVTAGTGLTGGTFSTTGTVALADTAVTIGTYGDADSVAQFTVDQQGRITGATNVDIDLDAAAVSSGTFDAARIPDLSANKITSDTLGVDRIPSLSANKITSDTLGVDRIPDLAAGKITSDTFHVDRIPTLSKSKISSTGTWNVADIPDLSATYLTAVSADTSPQLGGSLDVNGNSIVSVNNGNVTLNPNGTGVVSFANNTGTTYVNGNYGVTIKPPTLSANLSLVLPATDGTAGQYLKTDGSGNLGWATDADTTYIATSWRSSESTPTAGLVPATAGSGDASKYLAGDGNWTTLPTPSSFDSGMIMWWPGLGANIPSGWLECDGRVLFHTAYQQETNTLYANLRAALANVQGISGCIYDDQRTRVAADFPQGTALTTFDSTYQFALPDLRGEFIRGWDNGRGVDTNRDLGSAQGHQLEHHTHLEAQRTTNTAMGGTGTGGVVGTAYYQSGAGGGAGGDGTFDGTPGSVSDETRPRNIAMIAIIKT